MSLLVVAAACGDATSEEGSDIPASDASAEGAAPSKDGGSDGNAASDADAGPGADAAAEAGDGGGTPDADAGSDADGDAADAAPPVLVDFTVEPKKGFAGVVLGSVSVRVRDPLGQLVTAPTSMSLALASGPGTLGGTTVRDTTNGVATFDDLTVGKSGTYQLVASASGVVAESVTFTVDAWQPYNGSLAGGTVRRIAVDPTDANIAYATTAGAGLFRTTDGTTWAPLAFPATSTLGIAIDPVTPTTIYAGKDATGLYKSTDRGLTWAPANTGYANKQVRALAIDKTSPQVLYWGSETGLLKSTNGGTSWTPANDPAFATASISAVAVAPSQPQTVYVQAYNQQVYRSNDGGGTWTAMSGLPASVGVRSFAVHPTDPATVYLSLGDTSGGVWRSSAGGAFTQIANAPVASKGVQDIAIDPGSPQTMYLAAYGANVFKSVDGGATWTNQNDNVLGVGSPLALAMASSDPSTLYVGHYVIPAGGGFSKTTNGGGGWTNVSAGFTAFSVTGIAVDPANGSNLWVGGAGNALQRSTDKGATYSKLGIADGITWGGEFVIRFSVATPGTIYVGNNGGGVFKSTNNGASFVRDTVLGNATIRQIAPSAADPSTLYGGGFGFGLVATSNGGASWTTKTTPANPFIYVGGVAAHPTIAATAYAGTGDGLYRTVDSGQTWTKLTTPSPAISQPHVAFDGAGSVYAAGSSVQSSPDGNVWSDITTSGGTTVPLTDGSATYVGVFAIGGSDVVFVGAGGKHGLWRRAGGAWKASLDTPSKILSMAQDPSQPTTLYLGVEDGGMYRSLSGGE